MSDVLGKILSFLGVRDEYEDEDEYETAYTDFTEDEIPPLRSETVKRSNRDNSSPRKTNLVSLTGGQKSLAKMHILEPHTFEDVRDYVVHLKSKRSIILRLTRVDKDEAQRIVDFMSGATHALDGNMRKLDSKIFCFTPASVEIEGDVGIDMFDIDSDDE